MKKIFGQPLVLLPFRGRIHPSYNQSHFLQAISDCQRLLSDTACEVLIDGRNRVGVINLSLKKKKEADVVVKEFCIQGVDKLKSIFLPGKALKSWRAANALLERGIETPFPIAYLEKRKSIFLDQSYFLSGRVSDTEEIRFLFLKLPPPELSKLLISLAQHLSLCHRKGILHRDLSDGNILVKKEETEEFRFYLIDTNRIKIKNQISLFQGIKNLIRLGVPLQNQRFFLANYLGVLEVKRCQWLYYKINKKSYSFFIKLKKKLRLRLLAQKLKIQ